MAQEIMIAIIMNLAMFIIVKVINDQSSQQTMNYYKDQLEKQNALIKDAFQQLQQTFMMETASNKVDMMTQIKETGDRCIKELGEKIEIER
jgi:flagellar biosynthesis protein FliP